MGFASVIASSTAYTALVGFSPAMMSGWATTTIDTFGASVLGTVVVFAPQIIAGIMILVVVSFGFGAWKVFML